MSDLVGNPEDRFSRVEAQVIACEEPGHAYFRHYSVFGFGR